VVCEQIDEISSYHPGYGEIKSEIAAADEAKYGQM
jgi:hypothetical protein